MTRYDIFLSYNRRDLEAVQRVHEALKLRNLKPWFDKEALPPGRIWQKEAEKGIKSCKAAAVFFGPYGLGPWEDLEMRSLLNRVAQEGMPLIPVPLPGAPADLQLPGFLSQLTWVDLRGGITDMGIEELVRGIPPGKRKKPPPSPADPPGSPGRPRRGGL